MGRYRNHFITFSILLFIIVSGKLYLDYRDFRSVTKTVIEHESQYISAFVKSFRQTYQKAFLDNHISVDDKTVNLLPVRTIGDISTKFSESINNRIIIRTVSDRPRNIKNMANDNEKKVMDYFRENLNKKSFYLDGKDSSFYYEPLFIKQQCLKCHGKREDAIASIRDNYDTAYDYKLGDLRGILSVEVSEPEIDAILRENFIRTLLLGIFTYIFILVIIYFLIKLLAKNQSKEKEILEYKRTEQIHEMFGNIAHQWRQPLNVISTASSTLTLLDEMNSLDSKKVHEFTHDIEEQTQKLSKMIDDFQKLMKKKSEKENINIVSFLGTYLHETKVKLNNHKISFNIHLPKSEIQINTLRFELTQVIANLLDNAKEVILDRDISNGVIDFYLETDNENITITIKDNGGGIDEEILDKIFDPYFTTQHMSQGKGLGLFVCQTITKNHLHGSLKAFNYNSGAMFKVTLPRDI